MADECRWPIVEGVWRGSLLKVSTVNQSFRHRRMFRDHVLDPLCKDIETDLRLQVHSHLKVAGGGGGGQSNPFRNNLCNLSPFLQVSRE